jgi:hypothetical protein
MNPFFEDQSNPISLSARRDFNRMFQFNKSVQGLVFLGKQQFLQTGNTFAQTRLYNPLNVQIHSVPFVHMSRHVDVNQTVESLFGGSSDPERYARLQIETSDAAKIRGQSRAQGRGGILNLSDTSPQVSVRNIRSRLIDTFTVSLRQAASGFSAQFTSPTLGEDDRPEIDFAFYDKMVNKYRGKFQLINSNIFDSPAKLPKFQSLGQLHLYDYNDSYYSVYNSLDGDGNKFTDVESGLINKDMGVHKVQKEKDGPELTVEEGIEAGLENNKKRYTAEVSQYLSSNRGGGLNIPFLGTGSFSPEGTFNARTRYYKDPMTAPTIVKTDIPRGQDVDSIDVIFHNLSGPVSDPDSDTGTRLVRNYDVRFRAFIKDINESITPTYNENKYIGRYETFYTYNKVIRDLSFELTIQAFSKDEIKRILDRMSILTSFAYPKLSRGTNYQAPSIFKVTIGKLYTVQPCILQSLTHRIEEDASWDIDEQIPMSVKCNIQLRLLDKKSYDTFSFDIYKDTNITLGV